MQLCRRWPIESSLVLWSRIPNKLNDAEMLNVTAVALYLNCNTRVYKPAARRPQVARKAHFCDPRALPKI